MFRRAAKRRSARQSALAHLTPVRVCVVLSQCQETVRTRASSHRDVYDGAEDRVERRLVRRGRDGHVRQATEQSEGIRHASGCDKRTVGSAIVVMPSLCTRLTSAAYRAGSTRQTHGVSAWWMNMAIPSA